MTKAKIIEMLATSRTHATKLRAFTKDQLEAFFEAQTDPKNHSEFKPGDFVYCQRSNSKGIVTAIEKVPGRSDNQYNLIVKTGASSRLDTNSNRVVRYQG